MADQPGSGPPSAASVKRSSFDRATHSRSRGLIAGGAAALAISPFLTWVKVALLGDLDLFQLLKAGGHGQGLGLLAIGVGGLVVVIAIASDQLSTVRVLGTVSGAVAGLIAGIELVSLVHAVKQTDGFAQVSYGPWLAFIGCGAMVVGGLVGDVPSRAQPAASSPGAVTAPTGDKAAGSPEASGDPLTELERLRELRDAGVLTASEVEEQKKRLLNPESAPGDESQT